MSPFQPFSIHATNVSGIGAIQVVSELLPLLEKQAKDRKIHLFLPPTGPLSSYPVIRPETTKSIIYHRWLPRGLSRTLECLFMGHVFSKHPPLLVLGDIPIRGCKQQIVFLHQSHIIPPSVNPHSKHNLSFVVSRWLFRLNLRNVHSVIVQTEAMREALNQAYPKTRGRTVVITQPPPSWLKTHSYNSNKPPPEEGLILFYPSAHYPHKNHRIFAKLIDSNSYRRSVKEILLTIPTKRNPNPELPGLHCTNILSTEQCMEQYSRSHALIFPSLAESYGLPLVEAMTLNLPILVADLPYAQTLCQDQAIYFDPNDAQSLSNAISDLQKKLISGWKPDWSHALENITQTWDEVAQKILSLIDTSSTLSR